MIIGLLGKCGSKSKMNKLFFSICMPIYNSESMLKDTIKSILNQTFTNYEVIVSDNCSNDNSEEVVKSFNDARLKYYKNECNVGYAKNLELCLERASGDIIYLMSAKSKLSKYALERTYNAFLLAEDVGAVARHYYWYGDSIQQPVRAKSIQTQDEDLVLSINDDADKIMAVFKTLDNPAGLAYRKKYMDMMFHRDPFVEFTYPFASILKKHKVVLLKGYNMACPAKEYSGSQNSAVYEKSPMQSWIDLFNEVFSEKEFENLRNRCIKEFVATNYIGLVQVRNYARKYSYLLREIGMLLKYRWQNIYNPSFWFFSLGTMILPRSILIPAVAFYKDKINSRIVKSNIKDIGLEV